MRHFHYRSNRAALRALWLGASALLSWWLMGDEGSTVEWLLFVSTAAGAGLSLVQALSGHPAIAIGHEGLWLSDWRGQRRHCWDTVSQVAVTRGKLSPLLPGKRQPLVEIVAAGRRYRFGATMIELPDGGAVALKAMIDSHRRLIDPFAADAPPVVPAAGAFDPDAAIARYLAAKREAEAALPDAASTGLVRPPLARPQFGRRARN